MKTAERETPNRRPQCVANRADGAASQYRSCSIMWAAKQENFQPAEKCFFLTSPFIELTGEVATSTLHTTRKHPECSLPVEAAIPGDYYPDGDLEKELSSTGRRRWPPLTNSKMK